MIAQIPARFKANYTSDSHPTGGPMDLNLRVTASRRFPVLASKEKFSTHDSSCDETSRKGMEVNNHESENESSDPKTKPFRCFATTIRNFFISPR